MNEKHVGICPFEKQFSSEIIKEDLYFMKKAYNQAIDAWNQGEVPVGAVIVKEGNKLAESYNQVEGLQDATAHAEMLVLGQAAKVLKDWRLEKCTLYVTKEPCCMCAGALMLSRIVRVVYATSDEDHGFLGTKRDVSQMGFHHSLTWTSGIFEEECTLLLKHFFALRRGRS